MPRLSGPALVAVLILWWAAPAGAATIFATTGDSLMRFDSANPGLQASHPFTGLEPSDEIIGLDFRPSGGRLYGLGRGGTSLNLYEIDPASGAAESLTAGTTTLWAAAGSSGAGFDFPGDQPTLGRIVLGDRDNLSFDLKDNSGEIQSPLSYLAGDVHAAVNTQALGLAYTDNVHGAESSSAYVYDTKPFPDVIARLSPERAGRLATTGALTRMNAAGNGGFDIQAGTGRAFLAIRPLGQPNWMLYEIADPAAPELGPGLTIGRTPILGISVAPTSRIRFAQENVWGGERAGPAATIQRTGSLDGPVSVAWRTAGGTADDADLAATSGVVTLPDGVAEQSLTLPVADDDVPEADETVRVELRLPTGGAFVTSPLRTTFTIVANDQPLPPATAPPPAMDLPPNPGSAGLSGPASSGSARQPRSGPAVDSRPPRVSLHTTPTRLRRVLRQGLLVWLRVDERVTVKANLRLAGRTIGRSSRPKSGMLRFVLSRRDAWRLRRNRRFVLALTLLATDDAGNRTRVSRRIRLKR